MTAGEVEERVDLGDRHRLGPGRDLHHVVARPNVALFEHAEVEARTAVGHEERGHARLVHPDPDPVAGDPRLGDLEERRADAIPVADADLVVAEPLDREVLAELAEREVVAVHLVLPVPVRVELVHVHGPLLASVTLQITLAVAVHVQTPDGARPVDRLLPDAREHGLPLPRDLPRQPDVDRDELRATTCDTSASGRAGPASGQLRTPTCARSRTASVPTFVEWPPTTRSRGLRCRGFRTSLRPRSWPATTSAPPGKPTRSRST